MTMDFLSKTSSLLLHANPALRSEGVGMDWGLCQEAIIATRDFQGDPLHTHSHLHESFGHADIGDLAET